MSDVNKIHADVGRYEYRKQQQRSEEQFEIESDGHKAAVDKNKKQGGSGPAYVLQLSEEAMKKISKS